MSRDRDVRLAIQTALMDTNAFDGVYLWGLPENWGTGASAASAAFIEPVKSDQTDIDDSETTGDLHVTSKVTITFVQRMEDPQLCDEAVELLFDAAANALNGNNFGEFTVNGRTKFLSWQWQKRQPPERRITSTFQYEYIVSGWNAYDTTV